MHYEKFQDGTVKCIEEEIPFELPEGWEWTRLANVISLSSGRSIKVRQLINDGTYPVYGGNGIVGSFSEFNVEAETIVIGRVGYYCGSIYKTSSRAWVTDNALICTIKSPETYEIDFLAMTLEYLKLGNTSASTAQPVVSGKGILPLLVPVPPKIEQHRIKDAFWKVMPLVDTIERNKDSVCELIANAKCKILDLAIRGQLVPQDPNDEPASVLLERIRAEKEELIIQGKLKRDKKESVIFRGDDNSYYLRTDLEIEKIADELPFEIPDSWEWGKLSDIMQVNPRNRLDDSMEVSFIPMPLIDDGFSGKHTSDIRIWKNVKSGFTHFMEGDIGVAKITPCFENRKSVVFRNLTNGYGAGTTELHILRPYASTILAEYVLAYVKSSMFIDNGVQKFTGAVGQQRIGKDYVEGSFFPIPPLAEQARIVEQIDAAFNQLDIVSSALC